MQLSCFAKCEALFFVTSYAFLQAFPLWQFWYSTQNKKDYVPCNQEPCLYHVQDGSPDLPSSSPGQIDGQKAFPMSFVVQNGRPIQDPAFILREGKYALRKCDIPPDMQSQCEKKRHSVSNDMQNDGGGWWFVFFVGVKAACDCLHDLFLLAEKPEAAMKMFITSFMLLGESIHSGATFAAVIAGPFAARINDGCVCFYRMEDLVVIAAIATPIVLVLHFLTRFINLMRAMTFGDYLFTFSQNIPFRTLRMNTEEGVTASPLESLLSPQVFADSLPTDQHEREWTYLDRQVPPILPPLGRFDKDWLLSFKQSGGATLLILVKLYKVLVMLMGRTQQLFSGAVNVEAVLFIGWELVMVVLMIQWLCPISSAARAHLGALIFFVTMTTGVSSVTPILIRFFFFACQAIRLVYSESPSWFQDFPRVSKLVQYLPSHMSQSTMDNFNAMCIPALMAWLMLFLGLFHYQKFLRNASRLPGAAQGEHELQEVPSGTTYTVMSSPQGN